MYQFVFEDYTLLLSNNPCSIFKHFNSEELFGLKLKDCLSYHNTNSDSYIAGLCNVSPINNKPFIFINISRCNNDINTMGLAMHETSHLYWLLNYDTLKDNEEKIITKSETEAYKIVQIINKIK